MERKREMTHLSEASPRAQPPLAEPLRRTLRTEEAVIVDLPGSTGKLSVRPVCLYSLGSAKYMICELELHSLIEKDGPPKPQLISIAQRTGRPRPGECLAFHFGRSIYAIRIEFIESLADGTQGQRFTIEMSPPEAFVLPRADVDKA